MGTATTGTGRGRQRGRPDTRRSGRAPEGPRGLARRLLGTAPARVRRCPEAWEPGERAKFVCPGELSDGGPAAGRQCLCCTCPCNGGWWATFGTGAGQRTDCLVTRAEQQALYRQSRGVWRVNQCCVFSLVLLLLLLLASLHPAERSAHARSPKALHLMRAFPLPLSAFGLLGAYMIGGGMGADRLPHSVPSSAGRSAQHCLDFRVAALPGGL